MDRTRRIRSQLLAWYRKERRPLPWRGKRDAYSIWISEVMLQQTRVNTVIPYYERFIDRWPTVESLADADPEDVRASWSGLGYYRRARLMMDAARAVVADHDGVFPQTSEALQRLPGFGRYTAGAVASIAFDEPAPAVDGNSGRVLARLQGIEGDISKAEGQKSVWAAAEALAPGDSAGDLTQALIELGALVCSPRSPQCLLCPVKSSCRARKTGRIDEIPPPKKRAARKRIDLTAVLVASADSVVLEQRPERGLLAGLWCLPLLDGHVEDVAEAARKAWNWTVRDIEDAGQVKHVLTHRDLHMRIFRGRARGLPKRLRRLRLDALENFGIPSVTAKALKAGLSKEQLGNTRFVRRA